MNGTWAVARNLAKATALFAGLCAVDTRDNVEATMAALGRAGVQTTRMGAYKPRTSPYDFQGAEGSPSQG